MTTPLKIANRIVTLATLLAAILTVASAYGGHVDPRITALPAVLTLAFPLLLAITCILAIIGLLLRNWKSIAIAVATLFLAWPMVSITVPMHVFSHKYTASEEENRFTLLTFNVMNFGSVRGMGNNPNESMAYILEQNADVVLLQEASLGSISYENRRSIKPLIDKIKKQYPYRSHGYHDLILMSKYPYTVYEDSTMTHGFGSPDDAWSEYHYHTKAFDLSIHGRKVRLINVHLQSIGLNSNDKEFYVGMTKGRDVTDLSKVRHTLVSKLSGAFKRRASQADAVRAVIDDSKENVILCGDFNDTPGSFCYRTVIGNDMHDAWAERGLGYANTYNMNRLLFKIDHVLYRGNMKATAMRVDKRGMSDHYPQLTTFVMTPDDIDD